MHVSHHGDQLDRQTTGSAGGEACQSLPAHPSHPSTDLNQCNGNSTGRYLGGSSARLADKTTRILVIHCEPPLLLFLLLFLLRLFQVHHRHQLPFFIDGWSCHASQFYVFPFPSARIDSLLLLFACDPCLLPCWAVSFVQLRPVAGGGFPDCNLHRCSVHYLRADVLTRARTSTRPDHDNHARPSPFSRCFVYFLFFRFLS